MISALGKYAAAVIGAYAASIFLIVAFVGYSIWKAQKVKAALAAQEAKGASQDV